jgi:rhodanese-related sulfurtransferase
MDQVILDVRERDEYKAEHIANSICLPLSELQVSAPGILANLSGKKVVLLCLSGKRAQMAKRQIEALGCGNDCQLEIYNGGLKQWKRSGLATTGVSSIQLPIMRQVLLVAGLLILTFSTLGYFISPIYYVGTAFTGAGLTFAGATGFCLMGELLSRMPWNQQQKAGTKV